MVRITFQFAWVGLYVQCVIGISDTCGVQGMLAAAAWAHGQSCTATAGRRRDSSL